MDKINCYTESYHKGYFKACLDIYNFFSQVQGRLPKNELIAMLECIAKENKTFMKYGGDFNYCRFYFTKHSPNPKFSFNNPCRRDENE